MSTGELSDAKARERIEHDLETTLVVEAAAGTGKTTALISRIVAVICSGVSTLDRVVAVTFTEKAAGEMKLRLRSELDRARHATESAAERGYLEQALAALEVAHINTIHGFCADLLRERPVDAGVDPKFEVLDENASEALLQDAFRSWFEEKLSNPDEGLRRVLRRRNWRAEQTTPREDLLRACRDLIEYRDFDAPWTVPSFDRAALIDDLVARFRALGGFLTQARNQSDKLARSMALFKAWAERVDARERVHERDYDALEVELGQFYKDNDRTFSATGYGKLYGESLDRAAVLKERDTLKEILEAFLAVAEADLAARLREELIEVVYRREELKQKLGALDFVDLLSRTCELIKTIRSVRAELQQRFTHLFVDEFQDTDPLQAEILMLLASDSPDDDDFRSVRTKPGKLFVVGDPKQAIYRFRRADVTLYERIKADLLAQGAELLHLTTNFRSVPAIQAAVNAAFSRWMVKSEDGSQAEYVALAEHRPALANQPGVVALPVPEPYGSWWKPTKAAVTRSYPQAVGAFVEWLLNESGWQVQDEGTLGPIKPRHVCLLFKRFQSYQGDTTRPYVQGLEARRIPHILVGGRSFHDREEVVAIRVALEAIEWPDDELSVYATLRGPLLGVSDEELLAFRHDFSRLRPLQRFDEVERAKHPAVCDGLDLIRGLHLERNRRPVADTAERLLSDTRAHATLAMWPSGEQALANALAIVDLARNFDTARARGSSFRGFVETLTDQAERGQGGEAPIVEEGTEGVRLMTVHKAKGLEFPIVILCDPAAPSKTHTAFRFTDAEQRLSAHRICGCRPLELTANEESAKRHDDAELIRLSYVAATRARDLLVVPTLGDMNSASVDIGWADALAPALYPSNPQRQEPRVAPGCPTFGRDSVLTRSAQTQATPEDAVAPGFHLSEAGNPVVWWDPAVLELRTRSIGGVRQQKLLAESTLSTRGVEQYEQWVAERDTARAKGALPSLVARPMTELSKQLTGATAPVEVTAVDRAGRPRGPRFGTLVHAILAQAPFDAERESILALSESLSRLLDATPQETASAVDAALAAFAHPLLRAAASSQDVRREVAIAEQRADGTIAEGVIDLAYREDQGWVVIDFKTDELIASEGVYSEQLRQYVEAIERATRESARGVLLRV